MDLEPNEREELPIDPLRVCLGLARRWRWILSVGLVLGLLLAAGAWLGKESRYEARLGLVKRSSHNQIVLDQNMRIEREEFSMSTVAGSVKTAGILQGVKEDTGYSGSLASLSRSIAVENPRNTELLLIRVVDRDPERACAVARSLRVRFQADHTERALSNAREAVRVLRERQASVGRLLAEMDEERLGLFEDNGFSDLEGERTALLKQRNFVEQERVRAREGLEGARDALAAFGLSEAKEPEMITFSSKEDLPLRRQLARLEVELAGLSELYTEEHPQVVGLRTQVEELSKRVKAGEDRRLRQVTQQSNPLKGLFAMEVVRARVALRTAQIRLSALEELGERVAERLEVLRGVERKLLKLDRRSEEARELLLAYRNGVEGAEIVLASNAETFEVVEEPLAPVAPLPSKRGTYAALAFLGGFCISLGLALLLELRDNRIRAASELCKLGLETVHILPRPVAEAEGSYAIAAQVLFPSYGSAPLLAGLTEDPTPREVAEAFAEAGPCNPGAATSIADTVLPAEWRERKVFLVVPADRIRRTTVERYLRRAQQLGAMPAGAIFITESRQPFDTVQAA